MSKSKPYSGIWPALLTPIGDDGRPNLDAVGKLVELFASQGLDGLYVTGSTGQWPVLTPEMRMAVVERAVKAASGKMPVMAHVGAASLEDSVALAKQAAKVGADAVSSVTPIYYPFGPDVVFEFYRRIATATDLPLYTYHLSTVSQMALDPVEYAKRVMDLPNAAGMKITSVDLYTFGLIRGAAGDRLTLFSGADEVLCQATLAGAVGAIGTFYNVWGPSCRKAWKATMDGDVATGRDFQSRFQKAIHRVLRSGSTWSFLRAAVRRKYGIDVGMPRAPLGLLDKPWAEADVDEVLALVDG
jgi:N-acetylneuraminate lyase